MRMDGGLRTVVATAVAVAALAAAAGVAVAGRSARRQARQRAEAQDALIATLTFELESSRRERSRPAPDPAAVPAPAPQPVAVPAPAPQSASGPSTGPLAEELERREREIERLLQQVAELEADRARREERAEAAASRMQAWRDRMQQDPEAVERRRQEGREMLAQAADTTRDRLLFMQAMPTEGLAPEYLDNHQALLERLAFFDAAMQQIAVDPEDPANRELMPEMLANMAGLDNMLRMQRDVLLDDLARDIGYEGAAAAQFVEAVNTISEMTTMPGPGFLRRGLGGGRRAGRAGQ